MIPWAKVPAPDTQLVPICLMGAYALPASCLFLERVSKVKILLSIYTCRPAICKGFAMMLLEQSIHRPSCLREDFDRHYAENQQPFCGWHSDYGSSAVKSCAGFQKKWSCAWARCRWSYTLTHDLDNEVLQMEDIKFEVAVFLPGHPSSLGVCRRVQLFTSHNEESPMVGKRKTVRVGTASPGLPSPSPFRLLCVAAPG